ncbi:ParB/RepB/Spo0J family partition protein [Patescibacteria group bacterium]|nr:MAG: ParB/RepB/Spo0J family partition protein [Patescibacteria group bacterium]
MAQNYGLGRGLSSLIPKKSGLTAGVTTTPSAAVTNEVASGSVASGVLEVNIESVVPNPHQPRFHFNEEKIEELASSIKQHGIIQPLVVTRKGDQYELIAGERRLQAAKRAGLLKVPVVVRDVAEKEKLEFAIVENIQRHDLNPVEEARAYQKLMDEFQMHQDEVAAKMGKSRSAVANKVRLLQLPIEIQKALIEGRITEGHAKAILALTNPEKQRALFELILKNNLTVRQVEEKTKEVSVRSHQRSVHVDPSLKEIENKLVGVLGTKVKVTRAGEGGKIILDFYSQEDLDSIVGKIVA